MKIKELVSKELCSYILVLYLNVIEKGQFHCRIFLWEWMRYLNLVLLCVQIFITEGLMKPLRFSPQICWISSANTVFLQIVWHASFIFRRKLCEVITCPCHEISGGWKQKGEREDRPRKTLWKHIWGSSKNAVVAESCVHIYKLNASQVGTNY